MNYYLIVIFVVFSIAGFARSEESKTNKVTMQMVIEKAAFGDYEKALELLASMQKSKDYNRQLIVRAETAIKLARVADRLDSWEGSDFSSATPWYSADDVWKRDGNGRELNQDYFDSIIAHSVKRLEAVSKIHGR